MNITGKLTLTGQKVQGTLSAKTDSHEKYIGEYEITPKAYSDQTLATANKIMSKNVTVYKVPYTEAHNESGTTVYIAKEANYNG